MQVMAGLAVLFSILAPAKVWVPPGQPVVVTVRADGDFVLYLTDFNGKVIEKGTAEVQGNTPVNLSEVFPVLGTPSTYVLYAVPKAGTAVEPGQTARPFYTQFVGTPIVIGVRADRRLAGAVEPLVTKIEPLRFATIETDVGNLTAAFYYDAAPNTVATLLTLIDDGFYDGLTFHRIVPGFVVQGGDPRGDGRGGPGFNIGAEFSDRKHAPGVLSMARQGDPLEAQGLKPRSEFANTAGSQFFICLATTEHLDGRYTAFGQITDGENVYKALANAPLADQRTGRPVNPPVIRKIQAHPVTAQNNPYAKVMVDLKGQSTSVPEGDAK